MAGYDKKMKFLEEYAELCKKHGYYIDSARTTKDLRIFRLNWQIEMDKDDFHAAVEALLQDIGGIGG